MLDFSYSRFGLFMLMKLAAIVSYLIVFSWVKRINFIHSWCTPGGAIGYLVSIITRKKLVLDSFEPHAETMIEGHTWKKNSIAFRLLFAFEKLQLKRAVEVICAASGMIEHSKKVYKIHKKKYYVKPACVDTNLFFPIPADVQMKRKLLLKEIVCVYPGKFGGIYLEKEVFDFFKVASEFWKDNFSVLLLTSHTDLEVENYCREAKLSKSIITKIFVQHKEVPKYLSLATFGICPVKPLPSKAFCTPIKNGEFWAMGLPVVITKNISDDSEIIKSSNSGYVLNHLNREEYFKAVTSINNLLSKPDYKQRITNLAKEYRNFDSALDIYKAIYG